jgi:hypothetical protein
MYDCFYDTYWSCGAIKTGKKANLDSGRVFGSPGGGRYRKRPKHRHRHIHSTKIEIPRMYDCTYYVYNTHGAIKTPKK